MHLLHYRLQFTHSNIIYIYSKRGADTNIFDVRICEFSNRIKYKSGLNYTRTMIYRCINHYNILTATLAVCQTFNPFGTFVKIGISRVTYKIKRYHISKKKKLQVIYPWQKYNIRYRVYYNGVELESQIDYTLYSIRV